MKYFQKGSGEYLVLVHGALTDCSMWFPHLKQLEVYFDVIAVTLSHFEKTEDCNFGLNSHAEELAELVKKLGSDKPMNIVGWSYGADVVLNMLAKEALSVSNVFLYEPGYPGCIQEKDMNAWVADAKSMFGQVVEHVKQGNLDLAVESLIDGSGNSQGYFETQREEVRRLQLAKAYTLPLQLNQQEHPSINALNVSKIKAPLVFGYGEKSRDLFRLATLSGAGSSKLSTLITVENETHMLPQENPEKFGGLIIDLFGQKG
ncbi:alpha/beta fold hydrolase [Celerinatantimonas yamalensis]|uniref:Alpha/beta hydrolase n=1 Tax=Celerinatantimonas yamalensis TaxID=559956 RepID=A0ABW9G6S0_9GAMM